jgi:hypothetical protein
MIYNRRYRMFGAVCFAPVSPLEAHRGVFMITAEGLLPRLFFCLYLRFHCVHDKLI